MYAERETTPHSRGHRRESPRRTRDAVDDAAAEPSALGSTLATTRYITTVAGKGAGTYCGDGGAATEACLHQPRGVAIGPTGSLFIADTANSRIRRVNANGVITTIAGNGDDRFCGDGGPAVDACLESPHGVAVDPHGNVFIADTSNNRIRKVTPGGTISTYAGGGGNGFCGDSGAATSACLNGPRGVVVDPDGNLYIADTGNDRVRKVTAGGTISTVAGGGAGHFCGDGGPATSACLNVPAGVAADDGVIYIADTANDRVRKVTAGGTISTLAGRGTDGFCGDGGQATDACLFNPRGVVLDAAGNLYVADSSNSRVRKVNPFGIISTLAGSGTRGFCGDSGVATAACLRQPRGVAVDTLGFVVIADSSNQRVRKVGKDPLPPTALTIAAATSGGFRKTRSIPLTWSATDPSGIADYDVAWSGHRWNGKVYPVRSWRSHTTSTSATARGAYGRTYCFRQRARDTVGNLSGWSKYACAAVPLNTDQLGYGSAWQPIRRSYLFAGRGIVATKKNARITRTNISAEKLSLLVSECATCGKIRVYWNGNMIKTIDLYSKTTVHRQVVAVKTWPKARRGDLVVKVVSSGERVLIEGVGALQR